MHLETPIESHRTKPEALTDSADRMQQRATEWQYKGCGRINAHSPLLYVEVGGWLRDSPNIFSPWCPTGTRTAKAASDVDLKA